MFAYVLAIIYGAWIGLVLRIEIMGPTFEMLSRLGFLLVFSVPLLGFYLTTSPDILNRVLLQKGSKIVAISTALTAVAGVSLSFAQIIGAQAAVLLSIPLLQFLYLRGAIRYFSRRYGRFPVETIFAGFPTVPKGTPIQDRLYYALSFIVVWLLILIPLLPIYDR